MMGPVQGYLVSRTNCPTCGHPSKEHEIDVLGKARCPRCLDETCQEKGARMLSSGDGLTTVGTLGIGFLREMNNEALVNEIMDVQRAFLMTQSHEQLIQMVARLRVQAARHRIYSEAGMSSGDIWGWGD